MVSVADKEGWVLLVARVSVTLMSAYLSAFVGWSHLFQYCFNHVEAYVYFCFGDPAASGFNIHATCKYIA